VAEAALAPGRFLADLWEALAPGRRVAVLWEAVARAHFLAASNTERAVRNVPLWVPRRRSPNIRWVILIEMVDHLSQYPLLFRPLSPLRAQNHARHPRGHLRRPHRRTPGTR
jgi:hypothetical protein